LFADFFGDFCFWGFIFLWLIAMGIGQAVKGTVDVTKKVLENETVQEAGKGIFAAWLESVFKK